MKTVAFFLKLGAYLQSRSVKGQVVNDAVTTRCYAAFGKDSIGYPTVFLDKEDSIGGIDVFSLEVHVAFRPEIVGEQYYFVDQLIKFLNIVYENEENGFILYKKRPNRANDEYIMEQVPREYADILTENLLVIDSTSSIFPFLNGKMVEWAVFSGGDMTEMYFSEILKVKEALLSVQLSHPELSLSIHNMHLINSHTLFHKIVFGIRGTSYYIDFPSEGEGLFEMKIAGKPTYSSVLLPRGNYDIVYQLNELESINRFNRLLE